MKYLLSLLLLLPATAFGQPVVVGLKPTPEQVKEAKQVQLAAEPKILTLKVGEFEVIEPAKGIAGPLLWIVADETICQRLEVAPNQPMVLWMQRRGEPGPALHNFDAKPYRWAILVGVKAGQSVTHIVRNGATATEAPTVLDRLEITVGTPKPPLPPPPPPENELTKRLRSAAQTDTIAGRADKQWLLPLAGLYEGASANIPANIATMEQLDDLLYAARNHLKIPDPTLMYPTLRKAIQQEIYSRLGADANSGAKVLTEDTKRLAKLAFSEIAASLEEIAK